MKQIDVGFVLLPGSSPLVYAAAADPFFVCNRLIGEERFRIHHYPLADAWVTGLQLVPVPLPERRESLPDWLLVCGGTPAQHREIPELTAWLKRYGDSVDVLGGLASGGLSLAEAGLLNGYRAVLHSWNPRELRAHYPLIRLSDDAFVVDRHRLTCRGGTAAQDMMIWAIGRELGSDMAEALAQWFVRERVGEPGVAARQQPSEGALREQPALAEAIALMAANIAEPLSADDLARHAGVSRRQLERLFRRYLDTVPSRYYLQIRMERAREKVCGTQESITDIALSCGFSSGAHFSNSYRNLYGLTPSEDRERPSKST